MSGNRAQQKEKTRRTIIDAAFRLLSQERSYSSLSLREVTREAGIAPTSFYRHFEDMEELGLTLVDEGGVALRQLMRKARQRIGDRGLVIATSVETFMEFIHNSPHVFRLLLRERSGTSRAFRKAVSRELQYFVVELADYIQHTQDYPAEAAKIQAEAMVVLVFNAGGEALDSNSAERKLLTEKAITQLRFVAKGADELLK
ncbi:MAG: HTH-type transcriptional repressor FabR [endosymbiont of Galathealinum brachiosum]|uniref:HTH-type transcriptional repressor FabR n=1 Tax=endosymbiont of Galathealinum brachiosum TaxID=2200906 RepID=A0A370DJ74_9GAMM|nr:MAG: HTH-type transcriptional repressor FabR [endosymbiont of Galathealinum brachiosum]